MPKLGVAKEKSKNHKKSAKNQDTHTFMNEEACVPSFILPSALP
jgi:hypothetical protein